MKFSVITPTLNRLEKLRRCVGSVRGQTAATVEHFIQDGGSVDGTVTWLERQKGLFWTSKPDGGMYDAIEGGWSKSDGDVLSWLNSDEQYLPGTLERVATIFQECPDVDFVYGDAIVVRNSGRPIAARREIRLSKRYISNSFLNAFSCTTFFRRRLFDQGLLRFDSRYRYAADMDLILRLLEKNARYAKIPHYLGTFSLDGSNLSCHSQILSETAHIQKRFNASPFSWVRRLILLGRYLERLAAGSYRRVTLSYPYALDETPIYRTVHGLRVPGSYRTR